MDQLTETNHIAAQEKSENQQNQPTEKAISEDNNQVKNFQSNLLYEENPGPIPGTPRGKQDPRYVFAKFDKKYKNFDFTN